MRLSLTMGGPRPSVYPSQLMRVRIRAGRAAMAMMAGLAIAAAPAAAAGAPVAVAHAARLAVSVQRAAVGRPVATGFLGLGMEYKGLAAYAGDEPAAVNPVLVQLVRNLAPGQTPVLRIGGDSTD